MHDELVLWRRIDQPGHDAARLVWHHPFWQLGGTAVFAHEGVPCRIEYLVVCDERWRTSHGRVSGWLGGRHLRLDVTVDGAFRWRANGVECPALAECRDLDLSFSPATNLIALRRLGLGIGEESPARAAWLRLPDLVLEPLEQSYRRVGEREYEYEAPGYTGLLEVDATGMIVRYPGRWEREAGGAA